MTRPVGRPRVPASHTHHSPGVRHRRGRGQITVAEYNIIQKYVFQKSYILRRTEKQIQRFRYSVDNKHCWRWCDDISD